MLILTRLALESIIISVGDRRIKVQVIKATLGKVRLGIEADEDITIHREEIQAVVDKERSDGRS